MSAVTITDAADPAATVKYYPTAAKPPVNAEQDGAGYWVAPNVPMYPMSNGLVRIQFRIDQNGQAPSFRLSEFSVNKETTAIGNDANGSITNMPGGNVLAYDCENNLHCVSNTVGGALSLYWYDSVGRRVAKPESGVLTLYIWDGMDIIATANADGTIREYFTRGVGIAGDVGSLVAETRFSGGTATTTYLHSNWRGDVVMATDTSGNVVGEYAYTTFGEQLSSSGTYTPRFTFLSKERDASGLVYFGFRYYSPVLCRWISEDPIREAGGINLYQFCGNNAVNFLDPDGRIIMRAVDFFGRVMEGRFRKEITHGGLLTEKRINAEAVYLFNKLQRNPPAQMNPFERTLWRYLFDTSFRLGYSRDETWQCGDQTYLGREVNYLGQGMYGAAMGQSWEEVQSTIMNWKNWGYGCPASEGDFYWARRGYDLYHELSQQQ